MSVNDIALLCISELSCIVMQTKQTILNSISNRNKWHIVITTHVEPTVNEYSILRFLDDTKMYFIVGIIKYYTGNKIRFEIEFRQSNF